MSDYKILGFSSAFVADISLQLREPPEVIKKRHKAGDWFIAVAKSPSKNVIGHVIVDVTGRNPVLHQIWVAIGYRRAGVGTALVSHAIASTSAAMVCVVDEEALALIQFLRQGCNFEAKSVAKNYFGPKHDGYRMAYRSVQHAPLEAGNRISNQRV